MPKSFGRPEWGRRLGIVAALCVALWPPSRSADAQTPATATAALRIVVIAGEDAVNVIQQKTAVAPIVEVRDRNDQPVAGALVLFALERGTPATFAGGVQTMTVTTDAAGRAAATGLTPTGRGAVRVSITARSGELTATAVITQTNVATAAQAAAIAGAAGAAGAVAGAGAAAGGGLSAGAIAGIAGAVGGGAIVAAKAAGGGADNPASSGSPSGSTSPPSTSSPQPVPPPAPTTYTGPVNGQWTMTTTTVGGNVTSTCGSTRAIAGTLTITLEPRADGSIAGSASTSGTQTEISFTSSPFCSPVGTVPFNRAGAVSGTAGNLSFRSESSATAGGVTVVTTTTFSGALNGTVISGTLAHSETSSGVGDGGGSVNGSGSTTIPVTLTRS